MSVIDGCLPSGLFRRFLLGAVMVSNLLLAHSGLAQHGYGYCPPGCPPSTQPRIPQPYNLPMPGQPMAGQPGQPMPGQPTMPGQPSAPNAPRPTQPIPLQSMPQPSPNQFSNVSPSDFDLGSGAGTASGVASAGLPNVVGYIDSAVVQNQVRFRFDASYGNPTPDRAEFLYPKCGCFGGGAPGPPKKETNIDFQEFSLYAESLIFEQISAFVEIPFRLINPDQNENSGGLSDINCGAKVMLWAEDCNLLTFQFRTYFPSGNGFRGLGTEHLSLEPALLFQHRASNGTVFDGEIRDFIPIDGTDDFAGNVLRYGLGVSQTVFDDGNLSMTPVFETVAWSVLGGQVLKTFVDSQGMPQSQPNQPESAETTIVNIKIGTRFSLAPRCCGGGTKSVYIGYGRALTGSRWYEDTLRAEYRLAF